MARFLIRVEANDWDDADDMRNSLTELADEVSPGTVEAANGEMTDKEYLARELAMTWGAQVSPRRDCNVVTQRPVSYAQLLQALVLMERDVAINDRVHGRESVVTVQIDVFPADEQPWYTEEARQAIKDVYRRQDAPKP